MKLNFLKKMITQVIRLADPYFKIPKIVGGPRSNLIVGENTIISHLAHLDVSAPITIGRDCMISDGVRIYTHSHYLWNNREFSLKDTHTKSKQPIIIEDNVVIYANSIILPNVERIHKSCMILSGSVLTKSTTGPYQIWAGNPAKLIKVKEK